MGSRRFRAALSLTLLGLVAAVLLSGIDRLTRERIASAEQRRALATLTELVPAARFDNDPLFDRIEQRIGGFEEPAVIHRARRGDEPVALIFDVTTGRGYSGDIRLLVALEPDGTVQGVRVLRHRETPGLGDRIEIERSDWIRQFAGRSLDDPPPRRWAGPPRRRLRHPDRGHGHDRCGRRCGPPGASGSGRRDPGPVAGAFGIGPSPTPGQP